ncbi:uncharacterized protein VP01_1759g2 [Puccinia sorghi]|uniref:Uncharacterized protein n=1 Tax=Puccinia sorghi TaxID=27349 RepID=A0A0L6VEZ6_9BASI|nr:uncharacterized protein VP01_1759g2 [Puccinia sorghi]
MDLATLLQQLVDLISVAKEERKLFPQEIAHQGAKTTCQQAEVQAQTTTLATLPTEARKPKVGVPDKFDGMQGIKAEVYASQFILYIKCG